MFATRISRLLALSLVGFVWLSAQAQAEETDAAVQTPDQITLNDGSIIKGKVTGSRDGVITIDTDYAGSLSVSMDHVSAVETQEPVVMLLADETVISDQPLQVEADQLLVSSDAALQESYAISQLMVVNPDPWELGHGYKWSGLINFALLLERGNTDSDELDYKMETTWRSTRDRYSLRLRGENDENDGQKTAEAWYGSAKYDYFLEDPYYVGLQLGAEHDKFTDIDLRYLVGPFVGRQFYEEPVFTLSGELGVSYVNEDFIVAEDQDYPSANTNIEASSNYLGSGSRLYFRNRAIWNLDETSDLIVNTTLGLDFPLLWGLEAGIEMLLEYDSGAVEGVDDLDQTYKIRVGYVW